LGCTHTVLRKSQPFFKDADFVLAAAVSLLDGSVAFLNSPSTLLDGFAALFGHFSPFLHLMGEEGELLVLVMSLDCFLVSVGCFFLHVFDGGLVAA
jgi:hypothetical protein